MKKTLIVLSFILCASSANAQLGKTEYEKIDSLFLDWNKPNNPGGSIGIVKEGEVVFSKAYGLASLEYLVPNTRETIFNIGSISKQFTAIGIIKLALEGKLSIEDDIRKYMPDLPDLGETVTIRHMLHHTSGLRSFHALLDLAGWRFDDSRDNEDLYRFMLKQRGLNFKPGSEFGYSNTNYMLMVNIIEKVTSEKFPEWMKKEIFQPLGMINTYIEEDYMSVASNNATSYYTNRSNDLFRAAPHWGYVGSANVHSTTTDLLKWLGNFNNPQTGWETHFEMLITQDQLTDGGINNYAFGVLVNDNKGIKSIEHSGATGGYISNMATYPEENLSFVILTNFQSSNVRQKSADLFNILLGDQVKSKKALDQQNFKAVNLSEKDLKKFEGSYWDDIRNFERQILLKNDTLRYSIPGRRDYAMVPVGNNEFQRLGGREETNIRFDISGKTSNMIITWSNGDVYKSQRFEPVVSSKEELKAYAGTFYSPEVESAYTISFDGEKLTGYHSRHGDFSMKRVRKDILEGRGPLRNVKFQKNKKGEITGIFVSNGRVRNLWFKKQE